MTGDTSCHLGETLRDTEDSSWLFTWLHRQDPSAHNSPHTAPSSPRDQAVHSPGSKQQVSLVYSNSPSRGSITPFLDKRRHFLMEDKSTVLYRLRRTHGPQASLGEGDRKGAGGGGRRGVVCTDTHTLSLPNFHSFQHTHSNLHSLQHTARKSVV